MTDLETAPVGDFAGLLRALIATRGLPLERIRSLLAQRGHRVSVAALSYWQSGRSRPERSASLEALAQIEDILVVPPGFLSRRLEPPGALVPWIAQYEDLGRPTPCEAVHDLMARLDLSLDDGLERVGYHDVAQVNAGRTGGIHVVRQVLHAARDGADRFPVWYQAYDARATSYVVGRTNCRVGRQVELPALSAAITEMRLERSLRQGDTVTTEHAMEAVGTVTPMSTLIRGLGKPARILVMEARFHPTAFPVTAVLRLELTDPAPGTFSIEWSW